VAQYGQKPYQWKEFRQVFREKRRHFPLFMPFGWPLIFKEFERRYFRNGERNFRMKTGMRAALGMLWRNPLVLAYFVPILGWIPLLLKGYSKRKG
jgi:hypothetical protein